MQIKLCKRQGLLLLSCFFVLLLAKPAFTGVVSGKGALGDFITQG